MSYTLGPILHRWTIIGSTPFLKVEPAGIKRPAALFSRVLCLPQPCLKALSPCCTRWNLCLAIAAEACAWFWSVARECPQHVAHENPMWRQRCLVAPFSPLAATPCLHVHTRRRQARRHARLAASDAGQGLHTGSDWKNPERLKRLTTSQESL